MQQKQNKKENQAFWPGNTSNKSFNSSSRKPLVDQIKNDNSTSTKTVTQLVNKKTNNTVSKRVERKFKPKPTRKFEDERSQISKRSKVRTIQEKPITVDFEAFSLHSDIVKAVNEVGYKNPTRIQLEAIPLIMQQKDVLGIAQTGSGKTAAFALPVLHNLLHMSNRGKIPTVLIISPTRELTIQIGDNFSEYGKYTKVKQAIIYGGVSQKPQEKEIRQGVDIIIATPGRLLDLINQKIINLASIQTLILDEADRMFDMGFIPDIKKIVAKIPNRSQTLLFSATMPREILDLAKNTLKNKFERIMGSQESIPVNNINQKMFFVEGYEKIGFLQEFLDNENVTKALIFSRTKYGADKIVRKLRNSDYTVESMHGNKSQNNRQRVLDNFKSNRTQIVIATDLAARGLDVDDISHVINFDLPPEPETYMHRIGRTARAGKTGMAISLCAMDERKYLPRIERALGFPIPKISAT